jgi:hypothetical protein
MTTSVRSAVPDGPVHAYASSMPYDVTRMPAAAVYCSDGRYGEQMDEFLHHGLGLPRYDRVAVPGGAACLASHLVTMREEGALDRQLRFLVEAHELDRVVLIAHQDCGYYKRMRVRAKSLEDQQFEDLAKAAKRISEYVRGLEVEAYFARKVEGFVRFDVVPVLE